MSSQDNGKYATFTIYFNGSTEHFTWRVKTQSWPVTREKSAVHTGQVSPWFICSFSSPESEKGYMGMVSDAFLLEFPNLPYVDQTPVKTSPLKLSLYPQ